MENDTDNSVDNAMRVALFALAAAQDLAGSRVTPTQLKEIEHGLADGTRRIALFVSRNNAAVHLELALIDARAPAPFSVAILQADASVEALLAPADKVTLIDRGSMN